MITLEIPRVPPSPNELLGYHWRYRKANADTWQKEVYFALLNAGSRPPRTPYPRAQVSIQRESHGELDPDNLVGCVKPVLDALRYADVLVNDTPAHLELKVTQRRIARKLPPRTLIEITPIKETA